MRTYFRSLSDVLGSPLAQTAQTFSPRHAGGHRVLKSTKLEDAAYRDLRRGDNELDALEKACGEKLSTFPALSRDIYQSFYSLNVRRQPEDAISEQARRFNAPILNEVMDGEDYPAIKAACEGRQLPAYEAASEFISQVAGNRQWKKRGAEYPGAPGTKKGQEHGGASKTDEANRTGRP